MLEVSKQENRRLWGQESTAWKVFVFGIIAVHIFLHLDWIRRDTEHLSIFSPYRENTDQNNREYGDFLRSDHHGSSKEKKNFIDENKEMFIVKHWSLPI